MAYINMNGNMLQRMMYPDAINLNGVSRSENYFRPLFKVEHDKWKLNYKSKKIRLITECIK